MRHLVFFFFILSFVLQTFTFCFYLHKHVCMHSCVCVRIYICVYRRVRAGRATVIGTESGTSVASSNSGRFCFVQLAPTPLNTVQIHLSPMG